MMAPSTTVQALMDDFSKMSPEKRDAKVRAADKAIEKVEQDYFDAQWSFQGKPSDV